MQAKVIVRDLRKSYDGVEAVRGVSFEVGEGEIVGLLGPNGAGKTTTVECVLGLREPDSGDIEVCGIDARRHPNEVKQKIGAALQTTSLQDRITPTEALALFGSFYRERADPASLLERFSLADKADAAFDTLSGGQRQRLALALAFVNRPELVFLDEPTTGLDARARRDLHADIARMKHEGHTLLMTTHYIDEAEELCDRIAIIDRGRIVATGSPRELIAQSGVTPRVDLSADAALDAAMFARLPGVTELSIDGSRAHFRAARPAPALATLTAALHGQGIEIVHLTVRQATLEDVFLDLTGSHLEAQAPVVQPAAPAPGMTPALHQLVSTLRLQLRNRMGLLYGYLFPTIFLLSFWVLYRYEPVPLIRHLGELLTVTALGGACFGLPTTMVSERERGVWRRYRLAPVSTGSLVASTVLARYLLLLSAALLQVVLAMLFGMPAPAHPLDLWVAFTFVAFAFLGLGLVIAMLADNVPAVQALGQSIFLPMLIIGGVAVRLDSLPEWAQHASAFFPGRYAVEALQTSATGDGLGATGFSLLALLLIGAAGCVAAAKMFRWDARERFATRGDKGWLAVALGAWVVVGILGETTGNVAVARGGDAVLPPSALGRPDSAGGPAGRPQRPGPALSASDSAALAAADSASGDTIRATPPALAAGDRLPGDSAADAREGGPTDRAESAAAPAPGGAGGVTASNAGDAPPWMAVTIEDIGRTLRFDLLPPDGGVVTPVAASHQEPDQFIAEQLECMREWLPQWEPAQVRDPLQRVRNILDLAAAADMYQMDSVESLVPWVVFDRLEADYPEELLVKLLYWIAMHPEEGDPPRLERLSLVCLDAYGSVSMSELRVRTSIYAAKLLGRLIGFIVPQ